jgi:hypothetical protein
MTSGAIAPATIPLANAPTVASSDEVLRLGDLNFFWKDDDILFWLCIGIRKVERVCLIDGILKQESRSLFYLGYGDLIGLVVIPLASTLVRQSLSILIDDESTNVELLRCFADEADNLEEARRN